MLTIISHLYSLIYKFPESQEPELFTITKVTTFSIAITYAKHYF